MILIVGLGNPGQKYKYTRHNIGFRAVDEIAANFQFPIFNFQSISNSQISKGEIDDEKVILAKPQTFMNLSGKAVKSIYTKYKIQDTRYIFVIHDDIDLPLGDIRIVKNRGAAGHKGVESIIRELKTKNFTRFRIGINHKTCNIKYETAESFVLNKFTKEEEKVLKEVIKKTIEAIGMVIMEGMEKAMSKYNG